MAERLVETYLIDDKVEILLGEQWLMGTVVRHDFPAVWVRTSSGYLWFVTNGGRIRWREDEGKERGKG